MNENVKITTIYTLRKLSEKEQSQYIMNEDIVRFGYNVYFKGKQLLIVPEPPQSFCALILFVKKNITFIKQSASFFFSTQNREELENYLKLIGITCEPVFHLSLFLTMVEEDYDQLASLAERGIYGK